MKKIKIITFTIQDRYFALPTSEVKEVIDSSESMKTVFYNRGGALRGLMSYESNMISVLDGGFLLDIGNGNGRAFSGDKLLLVCKDYDMENPIAMTITATIGMEMVDPSELKHSQDADAGYSKGFIREGRGDSERVITVLDLKKFLEHADDRIRRFELEAHN
ncbi:MAG: chemotaxis protein CheW [Deltaproteobacteria bacterium]|nr:chemotaxis protein CheW [Deltaproteobacteria bacterium]